MKKILLLIALLVATSAHAQSTRTQATANLMGLGMPGQLAAEVAGLSTGLGVISNNVALKWRNAAGSANLSVLNLNASDDVLVGTGTTDAADSSCLSITGGAAAAITRGGYATACGNEDGGNPGVLTLSSGNASGAGVVIVGAASNGNIDFQNNGASRWRIGSTGDLTSQATNGGNLVFNVAKTGVVFPSGTVAATGSTQADAAALPTTVQRVTAADATKGVKLGALSTYTTGQVILIANAAAAVLKLYSDAAGETINGTAGTTAFSIAANAVVQCYKYDTTNWYCG